MRRNKILYTVLLTALFIGATSASAFVPGWGQEQQKLAPQYRRPQVKIEAFPISGGLYELRGGVSNAAFYVGKSGVYIFDTKMTPDEAREMQSAIAEITDKSIAGIILTHSDGDHVGGLTGFSKNLMIIAHNDTAFHMEAAFDTEAKKAFLPDMTFSEEMSIRTGKSDISLKFFGRAHTDGDAVIFLKEEKTAICGDLIFVGRDPLIHRHKNGSAQGLIQVLNKILCLEADTFLSGHAQPIGRADLKKIVQQLEDTSAKVKKMFSEGKSLAEVKKAMGIEAGEGQGRWTSFPENVYLELVDRKK
jgi:cyclase